MEKMNRRGFIKLLGSVSAATLLYPTKILAVEIPEIVVVGGGFAGSTVAKYLKLWGGNSVNVTIIETNTNYVSPILSNMVLNNKKTLSEITFNYLVHAQNYKINMVHKTVTSIDKVNKNVVLNDASSVSYDYLVLALGIDFEQITGQDYTKVPHAWVAGEQTTLLKNQIDTIVDGEDFIMNIPATPYRCPPGPYERACVVSDYLKNVKGFQNSTVHVLDANSDIIVEKDSFGGVMTANGVNYQTSCTIDSVDSDTKTVTYTQGGVQKTITGKVVNIIPNQKAPSLITDSGLNEVGTTWGEVDPISYESQQQSGIYIIGDSQNTSQPKAGHIANSEAKVCADAILRTINGKTLYQTPKTNSACYSPVSTTKATWLTAVYEYDSLNKDMKLVGSGIYPGASVPSTTNYNEMFSWSSNLFKDTFQ